VAFMAESIVRILLGDQWLAVTPLVQIMSGTSAIGFASFLTQPLLISLGHIRETLKINAIMAPVSLTVIAVGSLYSLTMVAVLSYITAVIGFIITMVIVRTYVPFPLSELARRTSRSALVTLITLIIPIALLMWTGRHPTAPA